MTLLFALINILLLGSIVWFFHRRSTPTLAVVYWPALAARLAAGVALGLLYKYYFESGSDTFGFFDDALRINHWAQSSPGAYVKFVFGGELGVELYNSEPRTLLFIKILSLVNFLSGFNYWISACWLSLFSFLFAWHLFETLSEHFPDQRTVFAVALLFFPSVVFWSSGILKESLAWGSLCLLCAAFVDAMYGRLPGKWQWLLLPVAVLLLLNLKYYWAAVVLACMATSLIVKFSMKGVTSLRKLSAVWFSVFIVLFVVVSQTHPNFYLSRFVSVISENHDKIVASSAAENVIHYNNLHNSWTSLATNSPLALFSGLFRPLIFEAHSVASAVYALENLFLLVVFVAWLIRPRWNRDAHLLLLAAIVSCIILCVFLSLSTPNFGTLSRYRIGFIAVFVMLVLPGSAWVRWVGERLFRRR